MKEGIDELEELLRQAAEMRCDGMSWTAIASKLNRSPATVSSWPRKFRAAWQRWMREAVRAAEAAAQAEARASLRQMLRSENEKTVLAAATVLRKPRHAAKTSADKTSLDPDLAELISQIRQLPDDELQQLLERAVDSSGSSPGMASTASPTRPESLG